MLANTLMDHSPENPDSPRTNDLREHLKELYCLFSISGLIDKPEACPETVFPQIPEIIRSGWQYPESTCVRICYDQYEYRTSNYRESIWRQTADLMVHDRKNGFVEVRYLKEYPRADEGPFLKEERLLINTVASRLSIHIQRKKDEKSLRQSRERLELALESAGDGLWDWNFVTDEVYFSPRWYTMLGYEPDELPPAYGTWKKLLHPEDRESAVSTVKKHISGIGKNFEIEFRFKSKSGKWIWILSRGRVMERDADGLPVRMLGTHTDISLRKEQEQNLRTVQNELEDRVARRTIDLVKVNRSLLSEIRVRRQAEKKLAENEAWLNHILDAMQTGVIIIEADSHVITDINRHAADMAGLKKEEIKGKTCYRFLCPNQECPMISPEMKVDNSERILLTCDGSQIPVLKSAARIQREGRSFLVESFIDISELKSLLKEQEMDTAAAKNILNLTQGRFSRITQLSDNLRLLSHAIALPCHQEGGDHYFVHTLDSSCDLHSPKTVFSLKDQSGHKVGCILRSIITDMLHHFLIRNYPHIPMPELVSMLNTRIVRNEYFREKDFVTAALGEIDHHSLMLEYMLCGHSQFLVIRSGEVTVLPENNAEQGKNMPIGTLDNIRFDSAKFQIAAGDRILLYTDGLEDALRPENSGASGQITLPDIITEILRKQESVSLSGLMHSLLSRISELTGNQIDPSGINRTADDITLLGLEIEDSREYEEEIWTPANLEELQQHIDRFFQWHETLWKEQGFENPMRLRVALAESAVNAWKHGNHCDPKKKIIIRSRCRQEFLLEVHDGGQGFDPNAVPDPTQGNHIYKSYGRGIMMIRCYADFVTWNSRGSTILMFFDKKPDCAAKNRCICCEK